MPVDILFDDLFLETIVLLLSVGIILSSVGLLLSVGIILSLLEEMQSYAYKFELQQLYAFGLSIILFFWQTKRMLSIVFKNIEMALSFFKLYKLI